MVQTICLPNYQVISHQTIVISTIFSFRVIAVAAARISQN